MLLFDATDPFDASPLKRSAVRCHVSTLALALTSVLWQQPQWRATPSPSGASELSQHRRQTFSADGDSGRSHLPLHDAALPLCSSVADNNQTQHPLRTQKSHATSSVGFCRQIVDTEVRVVNLLKVKVTNVLLPHVGRFGSCRSDCGATPLPSQYVQPRNSHTSHLTRSRVVREFDAIQP